MYKKQTVKLPLSGVHNNCQTQLTQSRNIDLPDVFPGLLWLIQKADL